MGKIKVTNCDDIEGLKVIEPTVFGDSRGYFMETYNYNDFKEAGIDVEFVQDNQSSSRYGVLRGLHFQLHYPQDKLVRVVNGEVFDVAVDLREGSIGSSFIKAVLRFEPASVVVVDLNENGLAELVRDVRSTEGLYVPEEFRCYTLNFADPIFERIFREEKGFDIFANFSAHKHVRSEKDKYSVQALIENNDIKAKKLMDLLAVFPPKHFFCVSTDKAANPVNIMGASKRIMEDLVMAYNSHFKVTTARFANVAFSNGSLPDGWIHRLQKKQPLASSFASKRNTSTICF